MPYNFSPPRPPVVAAPDDASRCTHRYGMGGTRCILEADHEARGEPSHFYRCASPTCPGLRWAASAFPHPSPCT